MTLHVKKNITQFNKARTQNSLKLHQKATEIDRNFKFNLMELNTTEALMYGNVSITTLLFF